MDIPATYFTCPVCRRKRLTNGDEPICIHCEREITSRSNRRLHNRIRRTIPTYTINQHDLRRAEKRNIPALYFYTKLYDYQDGCCKICRRSKRKLRFFFKGDHIASLVCTHCLHHHTKKRKHTKKEIDPITIIAQDPLMRFILDTTP